MRPTCVELRKFTLHSTETVIFLTLLQTFSAHLPGCTGVNTPLPGCKGVISSLSGRTGVNALLPDCRVVNKPLPGCRGTQAKVLMPLRSPHHTTPVAPPREQCLSLSGQTFCAGNKV